MNILKIPPILGLVFALFILLNESKACAQFAGSVTFSGYHSTNVEGRDSATPDNIFNPSIDLLYNWNISNPIAIKFEATVTPNIYQEVESRSYIKNYFSAEGNFYLSEIENTSKRPALQIIGDQNPSAHSQNESHRPADDSDKPILTIGPRHIDAPQIASQKLALLSELLDSFEIEKKGLNIDSSDIASDLKDSVSESILALSDILSTQIFTESIADVVSKELRTQRNIFSLVPLDYLHKEEISKVFDTVLLLLKTGSPESDILPIPKPSIMIEMPSTPTKANEVLTQAVAHLQSENEAAAGRGIKNASVLTLINSQTEFKDLSSQDILLKEDLNPVTPKTFATLLSVPASYEIQNNKGIYIGYSYREFILNPRLDLYFGDKFAMGTTYEFMNTKFPNDTAHLNDGSVHSLKIDNRIEFSSSFVFVSEIGIGFKLYDRAIQYSSLSPVRGRPNKPDTVLVTTPKDYRHFSIGGTAIVFAGDGVTIGYTEALTRSSDLHPYLFDTLLTQKSRIGGTVTDDDYSYELTRESIYFLWDVVWNVRFAFDLSYENRHYANVEIKRRSVRLPTTTIQRDDNGPVIGLNLSKEFPFDAPAVGIFNSATPSLNFQYTNYNSTVSQFVYKDMTITFSIELDF